MLLNPGNNADQRHNGQQKNGPQFYLQYVLVVVGLNGASDCSQEEDKDCVSAPAVVLPHSLGVVDASVQTGSSPHGEANAILKKKHDGGDDAEISVDRVEVSTVIGKLVVFDDSHASYEDQEGHEVKDGMHTLTDALLLSCMRRL